MVLSIDERVFLVEYVFRESSSYTYGPLARRLSLHQTFICVEQQNLLCIVIAHARLISYKLQ
jgi:hypothetical protein